MNPTRFEAHISFGSIVWHVIVWVLLTLLTFGMALFFYPYAFGRVLLNGAYVLDASGNRVGQLRCDVNAFAELGNIILWALISLVTFGIGAFFYAFKAFKIVLNQTQIVPLR